MTTPYEKRRTNLEHLDLVGRVHDLERSLNSCDISIARIKGQFRSVDRSVDLAYAQRQRSIVATQLAEARAREQTLARQLAPAPGQFDDVRQREVEALASFEMMERMVR